MNCIRKLRSIRHGFPDFDSVLLNPAKQLLGLALDTLEIVASELGPLLFQLAFNNVSVAFDFKWCHKKIAIICFFGDDMVIIPFRLKYAHG